MNHTSLVVFTAPHGRFKGTLDLHEPTEVQVQKLRRVIRDG